MDLPRAFDPHEFIRHGGVLGELIGDFDWSATPLGRIERWPQLIKTTVALILRSPVPIVTLWGAEGVMIYNDAYSVFAGGRHPELLGSNVREGWPEVAKFNDRMMTSVFHHGETLSFRDQELTLHRFGGAEQVWINLDYSPVVHEDGTAAGVIAIVVETTSKVRAERQISGERERLWQMFDQAPGFIALLESPQHIFAMANRAYFDLVGKRDIIGKSVAEALPEVASQGFGELLDQVYQTQQPFVGRATPVLLERDGSDQQRFVDFIFQPLLSSDGQVTGIFVQGHDVTDQRHAVIALQESEERFRLVAERAPVMLWMGDADGKCAYLNKAQREFWGVTEQDMSSFDWGLTVHPEDQEKLFVPYAEAMANHSPFSLEARFKRNDGIYRRLQTHAEPRFSSSGEFLGMIGVNVDITDAREAEDRYRRIFEQAGDLILTADLKQVITDCNPAAAAAVGLRREQAIGRKISEFLSPEDYQRTTEMLGEKLERGGTTQYDVQVRSSNGDLLFWEIASGLTFDDAGNPLGLHVVGRDVTERKRFERHQQLLVGELNHRVTNTLAIVQSLTHQSFNSSVPPQDAIRRFEGRLEALAAAHNLLTRKNWDTALIAEVAGAALAPFCAAGRCKIDGPDVQIGPQTAVSLALALHELATNAAKYGALSNARGSISVQWTFNDDLLALVWKESGGPEVSAPTRRGFGTRMIERLLTSEFGGKVELDFAPQGVSCRVIGRLPKVQSILHHAY